jgi:hypothetical protein
MRGAQAGRRPEHGDRLVKRLFLVAAAVVLFAPALAGARDQRPGFGALLQAQGGQHAKKGPGQPLRGERDKRGEHEKGHKGRLTEEERRELNRDLDRANREIYRR